MLVLSRQKDQSIKIGENIYVTVLHISGNRVRLGISAPDNIMIKRNELKDKLDTDFLPGERKLPLDMADSRQVLDNSSAAQ